MFLVLASSVAVAVLTVSSRRSQKCVLCSNKTPSPLCSRSNEAIHGEEAGRCRFSFMSAWCIQEFPSFKSLFSTQDDQSENSNAMPTPEPRGRETVPFSHYSLGVTCYTQLGHRPSCSPWDEHMSPIWTPESPQFWGKAKCERRKHLLVFLQSQDQLSAFHFNQELQWCTVTLMRQQERKGDEKIGSGVRHTDDSGCWLSVAALISLNIRK